MLSSKPTWICVGLQWLCLAIAYVLFADSAPTLWYLSLAVTPIIGLVAFYYSSQTLQGNHRYLDTFVAALFSKDGIDLSFRFDEQQRNLPRACLAINDSLAAIEHIIGEVYVTSCRLTPMADELRDTYASMTQKATIQHTHGQDLADCIGQMLSASRELENNLERIHHSVSSATAAVLKTRQDTDKSQESLVELANNIEQTSEQIIALKKDSDAITSVIDVINAIAEQTNLLALNAAIEAARAGEQGRGFAVVADEVRNLAARTSKSTQEVRAMVNKIQAGTDAANLRMQAALEGTKRTVALSEASTKEVDQIEDAMLDINHMSQLIHQQVMEQKTISDQAQSSIEAMVELNTDALSTSRIQVVSNQDLLNLAHSIQEKLALFKLNFPSADTSPRPMKDRLLEKLDSDPSKKTQEKKVETLGDIELF
ncbi:methyl-accepting chemotaxis protein [Pseudoalteromonas fenneropenaei]|uniref:Methyl-accepting chemotaxis protein n=1 Tax=Pseudoalteromonas fenneropenaei TaxID=1737459 RepID=A0ABV7CPE9_9GAMM